MPQASWRPLLLCRVQPHLHLLRAVCGGHVHGGQVREHGGLRLRSGQLPRHHKPHPTSILPLLEDHPVPPSPAPQPLHRRSPLARPAGQPQRPSHPARGLARRYLRLHTSENRGRDLCDDRHLSGDHVADHSGHRAVDTLEAATAERGRWRRGRSECRRQTADHQRRRGRQRRGKTGRAACAVTRREDAAGLLPDGQLGAPC
mmetsp:Transcript_37043/g.92907  ORF Transcript_37043/g.92907 Transcript_37043/m.92907 type:complete len:202 (-) Transcript_37043:739-1344(-)